MRRDAPLGCYVLGFGGHARSVSDVAVAMGIAKLVFVDPIAKTADNFAGFPCIAALPTVLEPGWTIIPAIGDNGKRAAACANYSGSLATLVAPDATVGLLATIGPGTVVGRHAHVGPNACVGMGVIVNTAAIVEHDCAIGDFTHVSINASIAGRCQIGKRVMIGAGAAIIDGIAICDDAVIGAGATVVESISSPGTYVGTPARPIN